MNNGQFSVNQDGNLITCRPKGAFDMELAVQYEKSFDQTVKKLNGQNWGLLSIYNESASAEPAVQQRVWAQLNWCLHHGCDFMAFVVCNPLQHRLVDEVTKNLPFKDLQIFQNEEQAQNWIKDKLAS